MGKVPILWTLCRQPAGSPIYRRIWPATSRRKLVSSAYSLIRSWKFAPAVLPPQTAGRPFVQFRPDRVDTRLDARSCQLPELAHAVDVLIAIVPGNPSTAKTVNADVLSALGPEGVFINVGRGTVVDEGALIEALRTGTIAAAGLDVIAGEPNVPNDMLALDNLTILPHIGSASVAIRTAMADLLARNLIAWFQSGTAITPVP